MLATHSNIQALLEPCKLCALHLRPVDCRTCETLDEEPFGHHSLPLSQRSFLNYAIFCYPQESVYLKEIGIHIIVRKHAPGRTHITVVKDISKPPRFPVTLEESNQPGQFRLPRIKPTFYIIADTDAGRMCEE